ncbi:MAG: radical SAM/SPASM domain-containing protein [Candidatus Nitrospinota bacterium M3_3B_026]
MYQLNVRRNPGSFFPPMLMAMLSDRCNYRCVTCGCYDIGDKEKELKPEEWTAVVDEFAALGGLSARFTGGEVLLRKETLYPLVERLKTRGLAVKISTNGSLIRDADVEFLRENRVDVVEISLHGREENHDGYVRVPGSFKKTTALVERLVSEKIPVRLAFTFMKNNVDDVDFIISYARRTGAPVSFNIPEAHAYYFTGVDRSVFPTLEQMERAAARVVELKKKYPESVNGTVRQFESIPALYLDSRNPEYYCARALMHVYIDSFGNVYHGCWAMPPSGNVREKSLGEILRSPKYRENRLKGFNKECPGCTCGWQMDFSMGIVRRRRDAAAAPARG